MGEVDYFGIMVAFFALKKSCRWLAEGGRGS